MITSATMLHHGYISTPDALVQVRELVGDPHSGPGGRAYACTLAGGLAFEVLAERGLDFGAAWFRGQPVAWRSPLGTAGLGPTPADWLGRFGGGLVVTCGLDNIGSPQGRYGQHGSHHATRAYDVAITRTRDHGTPGIRINGTVDSVEVFGRRIRVYREITARADDPAIHISDTVVNEGAWEASAALLYHLNFGAPLVLPGTRILIRSATRERWKEGDFGQDPTTFPEPIDRLDEAVWKYSNLEAVDGVATAEVVSPEGMTATVCWSAAELPFLYEWVLPARDSWALGIEPANAPLWGFARNEEHQGAPVLQAGERHRTELTIRLSA